MSLSVLKKNKVLQMKANALSLVEKKLNSMDGDVFTSWVSQPDVCRCCLSTTGSFDVTESFYTESGVLELYADMLFECYGIKLSYLMEWGPSRLMCSSCIQQLRNAYNFKKQVTVAEKHFSEYFSKNANRKLLTARVDAAETRAGSAGVGNKTEDTCHDDDHDACHDEEEYQNNIQVKNEDEVDMDKYPVQIVYDNENWNLEEEALILKIETIEDQAKEDFVEDSQQNFLMLPQIKDNIEFGDKHHGKSEENEVSFEVEIDSEEGDINAENAYENVEYLEEEVNMTQVNKSNEDENDYQLKRKWPKKLPRLDRNRRYKQYTEEALRSCLEEIRNGMSIAGACKLYHIPTKTVVAKLKTYDDDKEGKKDLTYKFNKEIKSILSFTNATPYKSNIAKYSCIYCLKAVFTDPEELRNHTRTMHADERTKHVDIFMRPYWENEILKLDIDNLLCVVCCKLVPEWNDMLHHLTVTHNVSLDLAYSKVIPYRLSKDLTCALCKDSYANYLQLDGHMNSHYENYMCSECGGYFLTKSRLKAHQKTHTVGRFPCEICHKVFGQEKYKRKHVHAVHYQTLKYSCTYCDLKFPTEVSKQNHLQSNHMDKIKPFHCEVCGKMFYWRQYYIAHKKKIHGEKTHVCGQCGKKFSRNSRLLKHLQSHSSKKTEECPICHNKYTTKMSLKVHIMNQHKTFQESGR